jgi:NAD+ synthase
MKTEKEIIKFIKKIVKNANASGVVIGLSGGVDSSLAAFLCVKALGKENVLGILMPTSFTPIQDINDAKYIAKSLGIRTKFININKINKTFISKLNIRNGKKYKIPKANILARIRMIILYYYANLNNYLVVGTGDKSESLIGYFTKYGDGGADFFPIAHLYKTQVRELAKYMGIPKSIAYKPSSPQLYPGHKATDEIPINYDRLDLVLCGFFDLGLNKKVIVKETGVKMEIINKIIRLFKSSMHKRVYPPIVTGDQK